VIYKQHIATQEAITIVRAFLSLYCYSAAVEMAIAVLAEALAVKADVVGLLSSLSSAAAVETETDSSKNNRSNPCVNISL
jgi:hypothetical protein